MERGGVCAVFFFFSYFYDDDDGNRENRFIWESVRAPANSLRYLKYLIRGFNIKEIKSVRAPRGFQLRCKAVDGEQGIARN